MPIAWTTPFVNLVLQAKDTDVYVLLDSLGPTANMVRRKQCVHTSFQL